MVTSFLNSLLVYGCTFMVDGKGGSVKQKKNLHELYKLYKNHIKFTENTKKILQEFDSCLPVELLQ